MNMQIASNLNNEVSPKKTWEDPQLYVIDIAGGADVSNNEAIFSDGMGGQKSSAVSGQFNQYQHS